MIIMMIIESRMNEQIEWRLQVLYAEQEEGPDLIESTDYTRSWLDDLIGDPRSIDQRWKMQDERCGHWKGFRQAPVFPLHLRSIRLWLVHGPLVSSTLADEKDQVAINIRCQSVRFRCAPLLVASCRTGTMRERHAVARMFRDNSVQLDAGRTC